VLTHLNENNAKRYAAGETLTPEAMEGRLSDPSSNTEPQVAGRRDLILRRIQARQIQDGKDFLSSSGRKILRLPRILKMGISLRSTGIRSL
jgi:hypothetical protein